MFIIRVKTVEHAPYPNRSQKPKSKPPSRTLLCCLPKVHSSFRRSRSAWLISATPFAAPFELVLRTFETNLENRPTSAKGNLDGPEAGVGVGV